MNFLTRRRKSWLAAATAVILAVPLALLAAYQLRQRPAAEAYAAQTPPAAQALLAVQTPRAAQRPPTALATDPDSVSRRMVLGVWEDFYEGKRTMTLKEDGTGAIVVELTGWKAALSAPRLRFDLVWSIEGGRLQKKTIGGEPAATVKMIRETMGDRVNQAADTIVELTPDRLLLLDQDGQTKYDWKRVKP